MHLVDVGGAQLEDALEPAVRRDRLDAQRHPIEERPDVSERTYFSRRLQPCPVSGSSTTTSACGILRDVAAALVEELERQRHVRGIDVVDVAQIRGIRDAVREQVKSCAGSRPWKQVASDSSVTVMRSAASRHRAGRLLEDGRGAEPDRNGRPGDPAAGAHARDTDALEIGAGTRPTAPRRRAARRRLPARARRRCP